MFIDAAPCVRVFDFITDFPFIWLLPTLNSFGQFSCTFPVLVTIQLSNTNQQFCIPTMSQALRLTFSSVINNKNFHDIEPF